MSSPLAFLNDGRIGLYRARRARFSVLFSAFQFFVSLGPTPWLDGKHTILGRISSGMKVRNVLRLSLKRYAVHYVGRTRAGGTHFARRLLTSVAHRP